MMCVSAPDVSCAEQVDPDADSEVLALWPAARRLATGHGVSPLVCLRALEMSAGDEAAAATWLAAEKKHWATPTPVGIFRSGGVGATVTVTLSSGTVASVVATVVDEAVGSPKTTARCSGTFDPETRTLALICPAFTATLVLAEDGATAVLTRTPSRGTDSEPASGAEAAPAGAPGAPVTLCVSAH